MSRFVFFVLPKPKQTLHITQIQTDTHPENKIEEEEHVFDAL